MPDICLPVPKGGHGALYIELKRVKGGVLSANQKVWLDRLNQAGNRAVVCKGWEAARDTIMDYLGGKWLAAGTEIGGNCRRDGKKEERKNAVERNACG